jgi:hypothetical protein
LKSNAFYGAPLQQSSHPVVVEHGNLRLIPLEVNLELSFSASGLKPLGIVFTRKCG